MISTDWNAEAELLKEYLAYCIDWRFDNDPYFVLKSFKESGILYINSDDDMLTFDKWKACRRGNFVWDNGPGSKVVFQPDEKGRWLISQPQYTNQYTSMQHDPLQINTRRRPATLTPV